MAATNPLVCEPGLTPISHNSLEHVLRCSSTSDTLTVHPGKHDLTSWPITLHLFGKSTISYNFPQLPSSTITLHELHHILSRQSIHKHRPITIHILQLYQQQCKYLHNSGPTVRHLSKLPGTTGTPTFFASKWFPTTNTLPTNTTKLADSFASSSDTSSFACYHQRSPSHFHTTTTSTNTLSINTSLQWSHSSHSHTS